MDDSRLSGARKIQKPAETLNVVVHLDELIVQSRVGNRCEVKNCVECGGCWTTESFSPIQCRQIFSDEISAIPCKILEITGPKIVDYREVRVWEFFLQRECEIGSDEPGAASDDEPGLGCGCSFSH